MVRCKICGEKISPGEVRRGTCHDCEVVIAQVVYQKNSKRLFSRKIRIKT
jgi:hypothetical protein